MVIFLFFFNSIMRFIRLKNFMVVNYFTGNMTFKVFKLLLLKVNKVKGQKTDNKKIKCCFK